MANQVGLHICRVASSRTSASDSRASGRRRLAWSDMTPCYFGAVRTSRTAVSVSLWLNSYFVSLRGRGERNRTSTRTKMKRHNGTIECFTRFVCRTLAAAGKRRNCSRLRSHPGELHQLVWRSPFSRHLDKWSARPFRIKQNDLQGRLLAFILGIALLRQINSATAQSAIQSSKISGGLYARTSGDESPRRYDCASNANHRGGKDDARSTHQWASRC